MITRNLRLRVPHIGYVYSAFFVFSHRLNDHPCITLLSCHIRIPVQNSRWSFGPFHSKSACLGFRRRACISRPPSVEFTKPCSMQRLPCAFSRSQSVPTLTIPVKTTSCAIFC